MAHSDQVKIRQFFIIDGLGALLSSFMLGIILVKFEMYFGIPKPVLYQLAFWPILFAIYDFMCYVFAKKNLHNLLKTIAILNVCYCVYSLVMAFSHSDAIKSLGWIYIVLEILVVLIIVKMEWAIAEREKV